MTVTNLLLGLATGVPLMLAVGPISLMLVESGLQRGFRRAWPAACGVAAADLSFATGAAVAGVAAASALEPVAPWLSFVAVALLVGLAARLATSAVSELRALRPAVVAGDGVPSGPVGRREHAEADVGAGGPESRDGSAATGVGTLAPAARATPTGDPGPARPVALAIGFYGLTMVNPLTIVVFASIVLSGSPGVGTAGWVLGLALASLVVHLGFVGVGHGIGTVMGPLAVARVRLGAAAMIAVLGVHLALG